MRKNYTWYYEPYTYSFVFPTEIDVPGGYVKGFQVVSPDDRPELKMMEWEVINSVKNLERETYKIKDTDILEKLNRKMIDLARYVIRDVFS